MSRTPSTPTPGPNRPQHERALSIIKLIQQYDRPNATLFARELEVTRRTIMRDLDFLRDRMHVPIEYDATRKGYYFSEPVEGTPLLDLRESDLLWLFVGQHLLEQAGDGGIADQVRESFQRVSRLFGGRVSVRWD